MLQRGSLGSAHSRELSQVRFSVSQDGRMCSRVRLAAFTRRVSESYYSDTNVAGT
jgi:hypothetical protein